MMPSCVSEFSRVVVLGRDTFFLKSGRGCWPIGLPGIDCSLTLLKLARLGEGDT
jgi:hypothetical protein